MDMIMRQLVITAFLLCLGLFAAPAQAAGPGEVIQEAVDLLSDGLDGRKEELAADKVALYSFIDGILLPRFDREFAAGSVLAKHWRTATEEQQQRFVEAFYVTLLHRYADGILEFDTGRVEIMPYKGDAKKRTTVVKTKVRLGDGSNIPVNYVLVNRNDQWRMFDVSIEGVSYIINYRKEMESEIRGSSLEKVIARLEKEAGIVAGE
jgi:phospholipid transport system substrate-binding protein